MTTKQKWREIKSETGQTTFTSPALIVENVIHHTQPAKMAQTLNRLYVKSVRKTIKGLHRSDINPLTSYLKYLGQVDQEKLSLSFKSVSMSELKKTITTMKSSGSSSEDGISMWIIKLAREFLEPQILHLITRIMATGVYPKTLKISKLIPVEKPIKDKTTQKGWRPINLVNSISKIVEKTMLRQILGHLKGHIHHRPMSAKSAQTLTTELYYQLLESLNEGEYTTLLSLDKSKANA